MPTHTTEEWTDLVQQTRNTLPSELGAQAWYLSIAAVLTASPDPGLLAEFYTYLVQHEEVFKSPDVAQKLSLQLRDLLLKQMFLIGAPRTLVVLGQLAAAQGSPQEKAQKSQLSPKWDGFNLEGIHARGTKTIHSIYGRNLLQNRIFPSWGDHSADFQYNLISTEYGIYLSDFEQLTPIETELVVLTSILCLGLGLGPALWHLRGLGRLLGARGDDENGETVRKAKDHLRSVKVSVMAIVEFVGDDCVRQVKFDTWPNVGDVYRVLGGWGEDV